MEIPKEIVVKTKCQLITEPQIFDITVCLLDQDIHNVACYSVAVLNENYAILKYGEENSKIYIDSYGYQTDFHEEWRIPYLPVSFSEKLGNDIKSDVNRIIHISLNDLTTNKDVYENRVKGIQNSPPGKKNNLVGKFIYFVGYSGYLKIGYTGNLKNRISALQTANAEKINLYGFIEGDKNQEGQYHKVLNSYRKNGEWFDIEFSKAINILGIENQIKYGEPNGK